MNKSTLKEKNTLKIKVFVIFLICLSLAIFSVSTYTGVAYFGLQASIKEANAYNKVLNRGLTPVLDELGYYTFTLPENDERPFKILQLTDLHLKGTVFSKKNDKDIFSSVYKIVQSVKPDLIIFTGDVAMPIASPLFDLVLAANTIGTLMENIGIPWTLTYGNHDCEGGLNKSTVSAYYESLEHCIFQKGPEFKKLNKSWAPEGNTFINILNADGSHNTSLALLDSNMYVKVGKNSNYDNIHDDQTDWYEKELVKLADKYNVSSVENLQTLAFYHIPTIELKEAYDLYLEESSEVSYFGGETNEEICNSYYRGGFFDKMVDLKSTKGVFFGHDHVNDLSLKYRGIVLSYGLTLRYNVDKRGGTVITLEKDEANNLDFLIERIKLIDIQ